MRVMALSSSFLISVLGFFFMCAATPSLSQYAASTAPQSTQLYVFCSLVDDPHKMVYYSSVFRGVDPGLHVYEKSFSTYLEMNATNVIGTAKCSSYQNERSAKASMANLQDNWQWIYKKRLNTHWNYVPLTKYSRP